MRKKMDRVSTPRFGEIAYSPEDVNTFPSGLVGLRELHRFLMLEVDETGIFRCLQSVENPAFAFMLMDPLLIRPDYKVKVDETTIAALELDDLADSVALVTVVVSDDINKMTANLKGPIVINTKKQIGLQLVLTQSEYGVKVPLSDAIREQEEELHA
jgi:flagellar assembly factor FliW